MRQPGLIDVKKCIRVLWEIPQQYSVSSSIYTLLLAGGLISFYNGSFWYATFNAGLPLNFRTLVFYFSMFIFLVAALNFLLQLVMFPYTRKLLTVSLLLIAVIASYFMDSYGVMFDRNMIQNTLETDVSEATELLSVNMIVYVLLLGVLPALIMCRIKVIPTTLIQGLVRKLYSIIISLAVIVIIAVIFYQDYASFFRNNRHVRYLINPTNVIYATSTYFSRSWQIQNRVLHPVGLDAERPLKNANLKPSLTVLVVGETARAENFSLNGYSRNTTPNLSSLSVINFPQMISCGTATAESVPCMFSHFARSEFSQSKAKEHENLLDILKRVGVTIMWLDNNSGCKGVCKRVETEQLSNSENSEWCHEGECYDEILLHTLKSKVTYTDKDVFVVLHQKGSHGPAYYKRYPKPFERFKPVCTTNQLQQCSRKEIINAYDNTIAYTDHFLAETIKFLEVQSKYYETSMIYLSDHGESLGENNIYLHGTPYFIAPKEQIHVPFLMWFSPSYLSNKGIDEDCLLNRSRAPLSQDYLFHSILGLNKISTSIYQKDLDIFEPCQSHSINKTSKTEF